MIRDGGERGNGGGRNKEEVAVHHGLRHEACWSEQLGCYDA